MNKLEYMARLDEINTKLWHLSMADRLFGSELEQQRSLEKERDEVYRILRQIEKEGANQ